MAPDPNCNCILMPWAQPSSFPEPCEYFDPSSRVKIIAKLFSELPGCFRITDPNFVWLMATIRDWIYAPISAESMTVWKKGRCFKEILVLFPWQLDLWNSGPQNRKFSHEFCVGQKKRWSPGTSRRGVCLLERDIFQFWQLVKSPCRENEIKQWCIRAGTTHLGRDCLNMCFPLFQLKPHVETLTKHLGARELIGPLVFSMQLHGINLLFQVFTISCVFNWPIENQWCV